MKGKNQWRVVTRGGHKAVWGLAGDRRREIQRRGGDHSRGRKTIGVEIVCGNPNKTGARGF